MRFFITIGDTTYPPTRLFETPWAGFHCNRAYVCPQCGDVWARWRKEDESLVEGYEEWRAILRSCPNHQFGMWDMDVPGSIMQQTEDAVVIPRSLLLREINLPSYTKETT